MEFVADSLQLKVGELLKEVQLDYSKIKKIDGAVAAIRDQIDAIPEHKLAKVGSNAAPGFIRDLGVPADKIELTFRKPTHFEVAGSYAIKSVVKPNVNVDVLIRMPKECFHEKDFMNHRYHAKRCLYLTVIEKHLRAAPVVREIEWSPFQNEARKPVLIVYPELDLDEPFQLSVRLIPTVPILFSIAKLNLTRNNVRALNQGGVLQPTPKYNSSILEDMYLEDNATFVMTTFSGWKDLGEALILLKVWARQRSSVHAHDSLNGFLISVILAYLTTESGGNRINKSMKALQMFRVTLDFIATSKLWEAGFSLQAPGQSNVSKEEKRLRQQSFGVSLYDISGYFNLAYRMTKTALRELQEEAAWTLNCMDKCKDGGFEEVFMTKIDFAAKFDYCMRVNLKGNTKLLESSYCLDDERWRVYEEKVHSLLLEGLTDRAKLVRVAWNNRPSKWNIVDGFSEFDNGKLLIGILVCSSEKSFRVVDIGPHAENKEEVFKFRKLWGDKAELRRFKDGTIAESTVWECNQWERHLILRCITQHVLSRHLSVSPENMEHVAGQLDFCLIYGVKDPISGSSLLLKAFDELSKRLRQLDDIPLKVSSVQPLDPALRQTSAFPPVPHPLAYEKNSNRRLTEFMTCIQSLDVMIQLEGSGNWPLVDVAIKKTKSAFLLKIGESLENRWNMVCVASEDEVNVLMWGYSFRLRILHERSINLVRKQAGNNPLDTTLSLDRQLFLLGQHASMVNGLQGRYPIYGPVVRLAKRWVTSHLFSLFLGEEAIELLVAYLFLRPFPFRVPCSRITGFLRFLRLLSNYDWTFSPLVIDINNDLTLEDEKEINENFMATRKYGGNSVEPVMPVMFLATAYDKNSEAWTKSSPNASVLKRIATYARSSEELLTKLILEGQNGLLRWESLLRTPLTSYDAVVLLHRDKLSYPRLLFPSDMNQGKCVVQGKASKDFQMLISLGNANCTFEEARKKLLVNFDPLNCFVEDLKKEFSGTLKVWYDSLGGDAIGLTWEKSPSKKRNREDGSENGRDPISMVKEVGEVGKGFVKSIHILKAPRLA
ncbi:hypothetical protein H6P81_008875 [Aristolochia fimbriata]|uniref:Nucleolar protein 6 n=1 Tax=Aristolochia fimbriata TaxID=158543 RepID=A0AAV7EJ94_ARIFI|nr:hypothetical protein H6P81_008875 [Aristolochia fimbriata]